MIRTILRRSTRHYSTQREQLSTLDNGVKVVTSLMPCHFSALGCYISAGSRYESSLLSGSSHILDRLAFKSTQKYTQEEMEQGLLQLGGNYMCSSSRETMMYQASTFHADFDKMVELVSQTVNHPTLSQKEVSSEVDNARFELQEIVQKPDLILPELGHQVAWSDGLGNPLLCPEDRLSLITPAQLWNYRHELYSPSRMTLAFLGVPHEKALELAQQYWGDLKGPEGPSAVKSNYTGGERTVPMPKQIGNIPVFEHLQVLYRGVGINDPDVYAVAVLQVLLGGGGSFSAGGPGKGMYSKLYTEVLNKYGFVENCLGVNHPYSDDGLFGITCGVFPGAAKYTAYIIGSQLALLMTPGQLKPQEVSRAKNQLRSQLLMNLETQMVDMEDTGRQIQLSGKKIPVEEMIEGIEALTANDLHRAAQRVLTGSKPSLVMQGEREEFGDVNKVLSDFGLGH